MRQKLIEKNKKGTKQSIKNITIYKDQIKNENKLNKNYILITKGKNNSNSVNIIDNKISNVKTLNKINSLVNSYNKINKYNIKNKRNLLACKNKNKAKNVINEKESDYKNKSKVLKKSKEKVKILNENQSNKIQNNLDSISKGDDKNKKDENKNNPERPEDINDYINMDEKEYNENYKDLNTKIQNDAIEEVEEAKEVSELNHSSEYYNSISDFDSKRNYINTFSNKYIINKKRLYEKQKSKEMILTRHLTFKNNILVNKREKLDNKKNNDKLFRNNTFNINSLNSKELLGLGDNRYLMYSQNINNNLNTKNKDNMIFKNNYLVKLNNDKNKLGINSYKYKKLQTKFLFKNISFNNHEKKYINKTDNNLNINDKNKCNTFIKKKFATLRRHIYSKELEKNHILSNTMPNLNKFKEQNKQWSKDNISEKNTRNKKHYKINKIKHIISKNDDFKENNIYSMNIENYKTRNNSTKRNKQICHKYSKYFGFHDKNKILNRTNDIVKIPLKNLVLNSVEEQIKIRKIKITEEKFHKLFKNYYLNLKQLKSKDIKNIKLND